MKKRKHRERSTIWVLEQSRNPKDTPGSQEEQHIIHTIPRGSKHLRRCFSVVLGGLKTFSGGTKGLLGDKERKIWGW